MRTPTLHALMSERRQQLLAALFARPDRAWYAAELASHIGVRRSGVQRDLVVLEQSGIIRKTRRGRMVFYEPDQSAPTYNELSGLIAKTVGVVDVLRASLLKLNRQIRVAFIYGSIAAGTARASSDVDLMVIGPVTLRELATPLAKAESRLMRPVNVTLYSELEFRQRLAKADEDGFPRSVLATPVLYVLGSESELDETIGGGEGSSKPGRTQGNTKHRKHGRGAVG